MLMSYYGVNLDSNIKFKNNAEVIFMDNVYLKDQYGKEQYLNYCDDNDLDPNDNDSKKDFVDSYENEMYCWDGLGGLITDYINDNECKHEVVFRYEEYILGVMPRIPSDEEAKKRMLTQADIQKILSKYLNPLIEMPVKIDWYDIYDD